MNTKIRLPSVRLRQNVIGHNVNHGTSRKRQRVWQNGDGERNRHGAQNAKYRLHHSRQLAVPETAEHTETSRMQWKTHRQAFGEVLDADANGQISVDKSI